MTCRKHRKHLAALLDGELPAPLARQLEDHLRRCPACEGERQRLRRLDAALARAPTLTASTGFDDAFARKLADARRAARREAAARPSRLRLWLPLAAATAVGLVALMLVLRGAPPAPRASELELARDLDLLRDYEVVANLEALEAVEVVTRLDRLLQEESR